MWKLECIETGEVRDSEVEPVWVSGVWDCGNFKIIDVNCDQFMVAAKSAPVPQVVTARQGKLALLDAGLLDDVEAAVASSSRAVQIEWIESSEFKRDWPTLLELQSTLGLTDQQIDDLFRLAKTL